MLKGIHEFLDESIVLPPGELDAELFPFDGNLHFDFAFVSLYFDCTTQGK